MPTQNKVGFGAGFLPQSPRTRFSRPYDVSAYTGIRFKMKAGSRSSRAFYFEILTQGDSVLVQGGLLVRR